jgi:hypothetical protein
LSSKLRHFVLAGVVAGSLAIGLFFGAAEPRAEPTASGCAGDGAGKPLCVTITGLEQASRTPSGGPEHYLTHSVTVSSPTTATSNMTNLSVTIKWTDPGSATPNSPTSDYRPAFSDSTAAGDPYFCTKVESATAPPTLTCTTPKSLRPGESFSFGPLVFRTATNLANSPANATTVLVNASAKEGSPPPKSGSVAFVNVPNTTTYEGDQQRDLSQAGGGITTTLATEQTGQQFSKLPVPAGAPRGLFELREDNYGGSFTCPAGLTCLGQHVTTIASGVEPVNLQITYVGPASGVTEKSLIVVHTRTGGTPVLTVTISDKCSGELFSGLPPDWTVETYPNGCRRVKITPLSGGIKMIEVDAWDHTNGDWRFG